jgi:predicted metallopeptidase
MTATLCTEDIKPLVEKLVTTFPDNLSEIDPSRIIYIRGNGKRRPTSLVAIKAPYDLFVKQKFILTVHTAKFDNLTEDKKAIALFDELIRIKDFETGTLNSHSVVGNFETLTTWGLDWLSTEDALPVFSLGKKA